MLEILAIILNKGGEMVEALEKSPKVQRIIWAILFICAIYAVASFITAIRWW